jgi:hypothetical protein
MSPRNQIDENKAEVRIERTLDESAAGAKNTIVLNVKRMTHKKNKAHLLEDKTNPMRRIHQVKNRGERITTSAAAMWPTTRVIRW